MTERIALVDCNNFYVSCERVFQPHLKTTPVAVLSNNDGCFIARSNEVKALGIPMGAPAFQYKALIRKHGIRLFSPNFELYGDLSDRVFTTLRPFTEGLEIYSIDEAFARLPAMSPEDSEAYGREIRQTILKATGIPVSVGIASTKTLAKVALALLKQTPERSGVLDIDALPDLDARLDDLPVKEIWGVGHAFAARLDRLGIRSAGELKRADQMRIRKILHVVGLRTVLELNGYSCLTLEEAHDPCQSVLCSRSFSKEVNIYAELSEAVAAFAARAAEKLRKERRVASVIRVFIETNRFREKDPYENMKSSALPRETNSTPELISAALSALKQIYRPNRNYKRAGVLFCELRDEKFLQPDLFGEAEEMKREAELMTTLDAINRRFGRGTVRFLAEGIQQEWKMKRPLKSPAYTTRLSEIPVAKC
jgi:DNA polymerase V